MNYDKSYEKDKKPYIDTVIMLNSEFIKKIPLLTSDQNLIDLCLPENISDIVSGILKTRCVKTVHVSDCYDKTIVFKNETSNLISEILLNKNTSVGQSVLNTIYAALTRNVVLYVNAFYKHNDIYIRLTEGYDYKSKNRIL